MFWHLKLIEIKHVLLLALAKVLEAIRFESSWIICPLANNRCCPGGNSYPGWSGLGHPVGTHLSYCLRMIEWWLPVESPGSLGRGRNECGIRETRFPLHISCPVPDPASSPIPRTPLPLPLFNSSANDPLEFSLSWFGFSTKNVSSTLFPTIGICFCKIHLLWNPCSQRGSWKRFISPENDTDHRVKNLTLLPEVTGDHIHRAMWCSQTMTLAAVWVWVGTGSGLVSTHQIDLMSSWTTH